MSRCRNCGEDNPEIANFCKKCGCKVLKKEIKLCPKCIAENDKEAIFCKICGISLTKTNKVSESEVDWLDDRSGYFTDSRDGQKYKIAKIGIQIWMAENLQYKMPSGCWAYENNEENAKKYGYLYNWETAKNACPKGWHLPSDEEWTALVNYLGGENSAGAKMKATSDWKMPNTGATNESGFTALPAGSRRDDGSFYNIGNDIVLWSCSPYRSPYGSWVWTRGFNYDSCSVRRKYAGLTFGFCARLVKD
jgi:uncharacterized protein (TIGR02145 family)